MTDTKRPYSSIVVDGAEHAPSRTILYPIGFRRDDFAKVRIGVATWAMVTPCNMHINGLADAVAMGVGYPLHGRVRERAVVTALEECTNVGSPRERDCACSGHPPVTGKYL